MRTICSELWIWIDWSRRGNKWARKWKVFFPLGWVFCLCGSGNKIVEMEIGVPMGGRQTWCCTLSLIHSLNFCLWRVQVREWERERERETRAHSGMCWAVSVLSEKSVCVESKCGWCLHNSSTGYTVNQTAVSRPTPANQWEMGANSTNSSGGHCQFWWISTAHFFHTFFLFSHLHLPTRRLFFLHPPRTHVLAKPGKGACLFVRVAGGGGVVDSMRIFWCYRSTEKRTTISILTAELRENL